MTTSLPVNFKHAKEVHPAFDLTLLDELIRPDRELWTPAELHELTATVASELTTPLFDILRFESPQRWWVRLGLTVGVEVWLLSWGPGQGTEPHDHGGASGSFTMLLGELHEEFRFPNQPIRVAERRTGEGVSFGHDRAHQLQNRTLQPAASVHAYSPPLRPMREYRSLDDYTGV